MCYIHTNTNRPNSETIRLNHADAVYHKPILALSGQFTFIARDYIVNN